MIENNGLIFVGHSSQAPGRKVYSFEMSSSLRLPRILGYVQILEVERHSGNFVNILNWEGSMTGDIGSREGQRESC